MNVIFLIFNRPELTARVFATIRQARPQRLFVVADGPRPERQGEAELVAAARAVTEKIDWPCDVIRDYSNVNLGCGKRVSSGITKAFESIEDAIILEDDCLPNASFYSYCSQLLKRYASDSRVMCISGNNFQNGVRRGDGSYYFSKYPHCWGWATWRRAWQHFSIDLSFWPKVRNSGLLRSACPEEHERTYWSNIFDRTQAGKIDTWAYPWVLCVWLQSGLTVLPNMNLVSNIGFGADATHTRFESIHATLPAEDIGSLVHPWPVCRDVVADALTDRLVFSGGPRPMVPPRSPVQRATSRVRRQIKALIAGHSS